MSSELDTQSVLVEDTASIPCGYLQVTCDRYPKVLRINKKMLDLLGTTESNDDWKEFLSGNLFLMIPPGDRDKLRDQLNRALGTTDPLPISHHLCRHDSDCQMVVGWVKRATACDGSPVVDIMYLKTSENGSPISMPSENSYFNALKSAYGVIFEVNLVTHTVECIHGKETSDIGPLFDVRMTADSAKAFWLNNFIVPKDRKAMAHYFELITTPGAIEEADQPLQVTCEITWTDGVTYKMMGVTVQLDSTTVLLCFRDITDTGLDPAPCVRTQQIPSEGVFIRTFGYFDVFCEGEPIIFSSAKEKELMALLVDRKGGTVSSREAISVLWETDNPADRLKARYRRLVLSLKNTLTRYGIENILQYPRGARCLNTSAVTCDYYEYLAGNKEYQDSFHNTYLSGYSWAEGTLSQLWVQH